MDLNLKEPKALQDIFFCEIEFLGGIEIKMAKKQKSNIKNWRTGHQN